MKLMRAKDLSDIVNKTTDRDTFYTSIKEIKDILKELSKYEGTIPFIGSPSTDLKNLERIERSQIKLLENRIEEKNKKKEYDFSDQLNNSTRRKETECKSNTEKLRKNHMMKCDIEQYARECNASIEHEEEMEQYKDFWNLDND